jgi:ABC-type lipoprotein export system ATPase subunit
VTAVLRVEGVSKSYRVEGLVIRALDGADFAAGSGEFVAVVGQSGSGKSTLLMVLGGLARPTAGRVLVGGADLYAMGPAARARLRADRFGFVFQTFQLVPYLSALENVLVPQLAPAGGLSSAALRTRARELLERFGLSGRSAHRPSQLSAGERQRVALARALLRSPSVLLADEPTGNLDGESARAVFGHLLEFQKSGGTVVLVTHDEKLAADAGRVVRLERGRTPSG